MNGLRSNWNATRDKAFFGFELRDEEGGADVESRDGFSNPGPEYITLEDAAAALCEEKTGTRWRRRLTKKLRALEEQHGVTLLVARKGRSGSVVVFKALQRVKPLAAAAFLAGGELKTRVHALEARVATLERTLRQAGVAISSEMATK